MTLVILAILCIGSFYFYLRTPPDQRVDSDKSGKIPPVPPTVKKYARQTGKEGLKVFRKPKRPPRSPYRLR